MSLSPSEKKNLTLLWLGQFISRAGDFTVAAVLVFLILSTEQVAPRSKAGAVWLFNTIPFLLFGVYAGALVDRFNRKRLMLASDLWRALAIAIVPLAYFHGSLNWVVICAAVFLVGSGTCIFNPARDSIIPDLVRPGTNLLRINSWFQTSEQVAMIAGTAFAGLFLGLAGDEGEPGRVREMIDLMMVDAATFLVSFALILGIRSRPQPELRGHRTSWQDVGAGLKFAFGDRIVWRLLIITALSNFFIMGPAIVGMNFFVKDRLHLGVQQVSYTMLAFGVGWLLGTLFIVRYGARFRKGWMLAVGITADGVTFIPYYFVHSLTALMVLMVIHAFSVSFLTVGRTTFLHEYVPEQMRGKVFGFIHLTVAGFTSLSCWVTGMVGGVMDAGTLFLLAGIGGTLVGLATWLSKPLRTIH